MFLAVKKERADREKESGIMKERIDNERKEIQISVDKVTQNLEFVVGELELKAIAHTLDCN